MLSRRENLLVVPWQRRRFLDHRRKVQSALPAIDVKSPESRDHVQLKRKKLQKEYERCKKIEDDNFILMKHLNRIMETCRVDNCWREPPPDFLHRIEIFKVKRKEDPPQLHIPIEGPKNRKERCVGCMPHRYQSELQSNLPEARIPYEPPKPRLSRRRSSTLASEEMRKEQNRLDNLEINRKKQYSPKMKSQNSSSPKRTNSSGRDSHSSKCDILPRSRFNKKRIPSNGKNEIRMKQIEMKKDYLELVLIFPAQSQAH